MRKNIKNYVRISNFSEVVEFFLIASATLPAWRRPQQQRARSRLAKRNIERRKNYMHTVDWSYKCVSVCVHTHVARKQCRVSRETAILGTKTGRARKRTNKKYINEWLHKE